MNHDAELRLDSGLEKMRVLQNTFNGLVHLFYEDQKRFELAVNDLNFFLGLSRIAGSIVYDFLAARDGGRAFELCEYSLGDLEREIEWRKEDKGDKPYWQEQMERLSELIEDSKIVRNFALLSFVQDAVGGVARGVDYYRQKDVPETEDAETTED